MRTKELIAEINENKNVKEKINDSKKSYLGSSVILMHLSQTDRGREAPATSGTKGNHC